MDETKTQHLQNWIVDHNADYGKVRDRLEYCRNVLLRGRIDAAGDMLRKSYLFAVMSIQTERDRHERAFTAYHTGGMDLETACGETVYGNQKHGWVSDTLASTDFETLARAVRCHHSHGRYGDMLDGVVDNLKGVSFRKASFMLAMCGMHEFMCVDSNVARYAGMDDGRVRFNNASEYLSACQEIYESVGNRWLSPFVVQWAIYDFERGEHSRHMAFYREVLNL